MQSNREKYENGQALPTLPPYSPPTSGFMSKAPSWMLPYLELARVDKPGFIIMYPIHIIGSVHAAITLKAPPSSLGLTCLYMLLASEVLVWVNFVWNDVCDAEFDRHVSRSRHRPLARGAVSKTSAVIFTIVLAAILVALLIPLPAACMMYAVPMTAAAAIYPLSKRFTNYPQVVLAFTISSGSFMGAAAIGQRPFPYPSSFDISNIFHTATWIPADREGSLGPTMTYLMLGLWTMVYELVYSYQDAAWDATAGIGTMTRLFTSEASAKRLLYSFALLQTLVYEYIGSLLGANMLYWSVVTGLVASSLIAQIRSVDLKSEDSCMYWFGAGTALTGSAMLTGFLGEYYRQVGMG